jgi:hypothetical protein
LLIIEYFQKLLILLSFHLDKYAYIYQCLGVLQWYIRLRQYFVRLFEEIQRMLQLEYITWPLGFFLFFPQLRHFKCLV